MIRKGDSGQPQPAFGPVAWSPQDARILARPQDSGAVMIPMRPAESVRTSELLGLAVDEPDDVALVELG